MNLRTCEKSPNIDEKKDEINILISILRTLNLLPHGRVDIMKILQKNPQLCTMCYACEDACSQLYFKEKTPLKASLRIITEQNRLTRIITCTQCGKCMAVCPVKAITRDKHGIVRINKKICIGCLMCVAACPEDAMFYHESLTEPFKCIACGVCTKSCPTQAIFLDEVPDIHD